VCCKVPAGRGVVRRTKRRKAVQYRSRIPLPHAEPQGLCPMLLCAADPFGLPNTEEVFL